MPEVEMVEGGAVETDDPWVPGTIPASFDQYSQMDAYLKNQELQRWGKWARRAVLIAQRDGVPEKVSEELRIHKPLKRDSYISTNKPMVSFRLSNGRACALLEVLFADGENTHITDRRAMVLNPETGKIDDQDYWFQTIPGDLISCLRAAELYERAFARAAARKETSNPEKGLMRAHVKAWRRAQAGECVDVKDQFLKAAHVFGLDSDVIAQELRSYRETTPQRYWTPKVYP